MAQTATFTTAPARSVWDSVKRGFTGYINVMVRLAEAGPRMAAVRKLNETTDAQLAAKGTTRDREVQRIFGGHFYL